MSSLREEIEILKKEKQAVILAHYYVPDEVQEIADYTGDSFYLSKVAKETDAKILVFAGVSFMGESAKILNPEKKVLLPDPTADCAMAHMADVEKIKAMKESDPELAVVCYINSTAELKRYSDVCVTSANAVKVVKALPNRRIYFIPDQHLGSFVAAQVPEKEIILGDGYCPVHHQMTAEEVLSAKEAHPDALVFVHPECPKEVVDLADYAGSTSGIIKAAAESDAGEFLIGTETGVMYELKKQNPDKKFYPIQKEQCCHDMKKVTLEKIRDCLRDESNEVQVDAEVSEKAKHAMEQMLKLAK
ncbi:quinolinate synthase NadA [Ruminococcus sp. OM05-10BH]|uniref:quinolinate synthase NadA n=1 Tax=Drancourtella sp. An12 TaxID=1965548 RepID=UPI000B38A267|nr:quinolinate synthase NadA [Drancourtella sp. An12]OUQ45147.1 quinolinate synthase [Drancourtella sp. An12]RHV30110.1 quinolinate synthase NadA [Ruminococcus sp. OM05-10BH]